MALVKVKGKNFRIAHGTNYFFPNETSCSVTIQGNMQDATTKSTPGLWKMEEMTNKQWNVNLEQKVDGLEWLRIMIGYAVGDETVLIGWDEGDDNSDPKRRGFSRFGQAWLNDLTINANDREDITMSSQWQGNVQIG